MAQNSGPIFMLRQCVDLEIVKEANVRVLSIIAPELKNTYSRYRKINLYKSLITHRILCHRIKKIKSASRF